MRNIQSLRGFNDILPSETVYWQYIEALLQSLANNYGYEEIRMPFLEETALFARSIGDVTDIVSKEMFSFIDKHPESKKEEEISISLRPEGTASCVRAGIENRLLYNQIQRLWYLGPMFRHERPQKGRYRQFYQFGMEVFGLAGPDVDAELLFFIAQLWKRLGIENIKLEINSIGSLQARNDYRNVLVEYFKDYQTLLDEDNQKRLEKNPLRILDSKQKDLQPIIQKAPLLKDNLDQESADDFHLLCEILEKAEITYTLNPYLVRGLDYYNKTVFEWTTQDLGAQATVCAGGRYDGLVEQLGDKPTPAAGFALGIERLLLLLQAQDKLPKAPTPDIYVAYLGESTKIPAMLLAEKVRQMLPQAKIIMHCGNTGKLKKQLEKADKLQAKFALILGEEEMQNNAVVLKPLQGQGEQITLSQTDLSASLQKYF